MNSPAIDRIRKLLSLAYCPGATPAEAANAICKATALAEKEGLSLGDIEVKADQASPLTHEIVLTPVSRFQQKAAHTISRQIGTELLMASGSMRGIIFIGLPHQVAIASQAFRFLVESMEKAWKQRPDKTVKDRTGYAVGFCEAVDARLAAAIQRPGLIIAAADYIQGSLTKEMNAIYRETKSKPKEITVDTRAVRQGHSDGRSTDCSHVIPSPTPPPIAERSATRRPIPSDFL